MELNRSKSRFVPFAFLRFFLGRCYCAEHDGRLEIYRHFRRPRLVAIRQHDGRWYIRRKYRKFYSMEYILNVAESWKGNTPEKPDGHR